MNKIMIGCPVRNRAWILPQYLACLKDLDYPSELISYCFVINDSVDSTADILADFARAQGEQVKLIFANQAVSPSPAHHRGTYKFSHLAILRNHLLEAFLKSNSDYLFSIDSDILVPPQSLITLINNNCNIVSALVCNGHVVGDEGIFNILNHVDGHWIHLRNFPRDRIFQVDCTGAAYLIKREVIEKHCVRYSAHAGAEDIGFCLNAAGKGLPIYCDGRIECQHIMEERVDSGQWTVES